MSAPVEKPALVPADEKKIGTHEWITAGVVVLVILCQLGVHIPSALWNAFGVPVFANSLATPIPTPRLACVENGKVVECSASAEHH